MVPILILLLAFGCLAGASPATASHQDHLLAPEAVCPQQTNLELGADEATQVMWCMHQYARAQSGRTELRPLPSLAWSAERKAADIQRCGEFSHTACDHDTAHWVQRTRFARRCYRIKENIAYRWPSSGTLRAVMSGWLHSDPHRRILLMQRHRWLGLGVVVGPFLEAPDTAVWVAHFGRRC